MSLLYDESHNEPKLGDYYSALTRYLSNQGERVDAHKTSPLNLEALKGYAMLIISFPQKPFLDEEISSLVEYVEQGGGLFLVAEEGDFNHFKDHLNKVSKNFDITFNDDEVLDPTDQVGEYSSIIHTFEEHSITKGVNKFVIYGGCSLNVGGNALILAKGDDDSYSSEGHYKEGEYPPVLAVVEHGAGRVACIGDGSFFRNNFINEFNNKQLALNIVRWLSGKSEETEVSREDVFREIEELEKKYDGLNTSYSEGKLDEESYRKKAEEYGQKLDQLERRLKG